MDKDTILEYLNSGKNPSIIITWYCIEKGKDAISTENFIKALQLSTFYDITGNNMLEYCYNYALTYYIMKYDIILLYDKTGKFIKAF